MITIIHLSGDRIVFNRGVLWLEIPFLPGNFGGGGGFQAILEHCGMLKIPPGTHPVVLGYLCSDLPGKPFHHYKQCMCFQLYTIFLAFFSFCLKKVKITGPLNLLYGFGLA